MSAALNKPADPTPPIKATRELARIVDQYHKYWMLDAQTKPKLDAAKKALATKLVELGADAVKSKYGVIALRTHDVTKVDHDAILNELVDRHLVSREVITSLLEKHTKVIPTAPYASPPQGWGAQAKAA